MAKTNYTKAEEALREALQKISVEQLLELADAHHGTANSTAEEALQMARARQHIVNGLQRDLKKLSKSDNDIYAKLEIKRKSFEQLLVEPVKLSAEDWATIVAVKSKVDEAIKQLPASTETNDQLVEQQRHKHINKRFNVNDKWLPLK